MTASTHVHAPDAPLLAVRGLTKHFPIRTGILQRVTGAVKAVEQVSFDVGRGETLALVGESGCGKTTTGRALLRLIEPTAGSVHFGGTDVLQLRGEALRQMRRRMQIVLQDTYATLNPRMTVGNANKQAMLDQDQRFHFPRLLGALWESEDHLYRDTEVPDQSGRAAQRVRTYR
ncbi:ATP-binding cassette domain-containing protein, partial [Gemmatimonas sp.]|uniref:ATP-binding cassette domain-containing protein n=1 Tax=Gemmatimonas sp. TaxID=1962908 RepID=UPI00391CDCE4